MLKFKNEAEFAKWQAGLADKPKLRVAASMGERVEIRPNAAVVRTAAIRKSRIAAWLPSRAAVARVYACGCWALLVTGMLGTAFCLGAACGEAHLASLLP